MNFKYFDKKTSIHRLHPACKIIWVFGVIFASILINDPILLFLIFISTITFAIYGKIFREWFSLIKLALWLSFIIIFINTIASQNGSTILLYINVTDLIAIQFNLESIIFGLAMSLRLLSALSAFAILTLSIDPDDFMQVILHLKFPYKAVLTTNIAIKFIPCVLSDLQILQDSVKTRGYNLDDKKIFGKIRRKSSLISPLLTNSLDRSIQLAEAMESRGFGSSKKTFYKSIKTTFIDYYFIYLSTIIFLIVFLIWSLKISSFQYYPTLSGINFTGEYLTSSIFLMFIIASPAIFSPLKKVIDLD